MLLTNLKVQKAKPQTKQYKLSDERGMYLLVHPNGGKYWRLDYRFEGRRKTLAIGAHPEVSLKEARKRRDRARSDIEDGIDPSGQKNRKAVIDDDSFEAVAREWHEKFRSQWTESHANTTLRRLEANLLPWLGKRPLGAIEPPELLRSLRRIENRGAVETAHRIQQIASRIFRYGVATGRCSRDPTLDLKGALAPKHSEHFPTITDPKKIGALLRAVGDYQGSFITRIALQIAPLVFVRPGELRHAEWAEIDLDHAEWRIPSTKMKMKRDHIVPLSNQAIQILEEIKPLTSNGRYIFPSTRSQNRPMSENTVNGALRRLGYGVDEFTGHSFRSMASTLLNENGWNRDAIERQLAHVEGNSVRAAYNYAEHLEERRRMMQWWADYLDELRMTPQVRQR
jgi:integrase|tara:strand:+ start:202 stop:1392 length:1191 start_codon:yes stop_codon:yes gene_type:complete